MFQGHAKNSMQTHGSRQISAMGNKAQQLNAITCTRVWRLNFCYDCGVAKRQIPRGQESPCVKKSFGSFSAVPEATQEGAVTLQPNEGQGPLQLDFGPGALSVNEVAVVVRARGSGLH